MRHENVMIEDKMNRYNSWKKIEDIEIDLSDLLKRLCRQWKQILVCALAAAIILGGYGWMKNRSGTVSDAVQEIEMTEEEEQAVADAVRLESEIRDLEKYVDNSVLMQLDAYHKTRYIMLYCIDGVKRKEVQTVAESYLNFVSNGGAADALMESGQSWKMDKSCLAELISAYQRTYSYPYQIEVNGSEDSIQEADALFYVEITGRNTNEARKMALEFQNVLTAYSHEMQKMAKHSLKLISSMESITADSSLQSWQHDKKALLSSNRTNLKSMTDAFGKTQKAAYEEAAGVAEKNIQEVQENVSVSKSYIKYIVLGFMAGIFIYGGLFSCWYVFSDTVKSVDEMRGLYSFPVYDGISMNVENREKSKVLNRIRLSCQNMETEKIYAVSDFIFDEKERECLEYMEEQLKSWKIEMQTAENIFEDIAVWDSLTKAARVFMVCRIGTTTHKMIEDVMDFYLENGITVMGAIVFLQAGQI